MSYNKFTKFKHSLSFIRDTRLHVYDETLNIYVVCTQRRRQSHLGRLTPLRASLLATHTDCIKALPFPPRGTRQIYIKNHHVVYA